jgi:flagellar basal body-associated protein FliL
VNGNEMDRANGQLGQQPQKTSKLWLWILIGIIGGIVLVVIGVIVYIFWGVKFNPNTYPYIPAPKNTVRSRSFPELAANIALDANETAVDYSVYRQTSGGLQ